MINLAYSENTEKLQDRLQCLRYLATHTVEVGLTSSASGRSRTLLAIHEHGSPAMHIPARPVVKPALAKPSVRAEMRQAMMNACAAALDGDLSGVTAAQRAGDTHRRLDPEPGLRKTGEGKRKVRHDAIGRYRTAV
jgi:hypothetical protein